MNKRYNIRNPQSLVFAIEIPNFHEDWECVSLGYDDKGYHVSCHQVSCLSLRKLSSPEQISLEELGRCEKELKLREYPNFLDNVEISAFEYQFKDNVWDPSMLMTSNMVRTTKKGIKYEFTKLDKGEYKGYLTTFYSPFPLNNIFSNFYEEYSYDSLLIYGKYTITTKIANASISDSTIDNKVIDLFEKIIDSIIFINPYNYQEENKTTSSGIIKIR